MGKIVGSIGPKVGIGVTEWYPTDINQELAAIYGLSERAELCFYRLRTHYVWRGGNLAYDPAKVCTKIGYKTIRSFNTAFGELVERGIVNIENGMVRFAYADRLIPNVQPGHQSKTAKAASSMDSDDSPNVRIFPASFKREAVYDKTNGHCYYCGVVLVVGKKGANQFQIDHMTPVRRGGTEDLDNLVPSCRACNCSKGPMTAEEFLAKRGAV